MENENTKNDLLNEIVNLSNSNMSNLDLMIDTNKYKNTMKNIQEQKKKDYMKQKSANILNFNFDQALSENINKDTNDKNTNNELKLSVKLESKNNNLFDEADDILNNFTKNLKSKDNLKVNLNTGINNNNNKINKSQPHNIENKLNPIKEENENNNENKNQVNNDINNDNNNNNNNNNIVIENANENNKIDEKNENNKNGKEIENNKNDKKDLKLSNLEYCKFNKEENKKSLDTIFDMLNFDKKIGLKNKFISSKELIIPPNFENINDYNKEINILEDKKEGKNNNNNNNNNNNDNDSNSSFIEEKKKEDEEKDDNKKENFENININKIIENENNENKKINDINEIENINKKVDNNENNLNNNLINDKNEKDENVKKTIINNDNDNENNINNKNIIEIDNNENNRDKNEINHINENNKNKSNLNDENKEIDEPKIELTGLKIDLVEKTEYYTFSKNKNISELKNYLNNNKYINLQKNNNQKKETILYDIIESFAKNKLLTEFFNQKITALYLDSHEFIYCGDEKGNLLIYNIKEEKLIKQLENPFITNTKTNKYCHINCISSDDQYIIAGYEKGKFAIFLKNEKKPIKTKIFDAFQEISQHNIIETKIYSKKKNSIVIYSSDDQENIYRTKIIKKLLKNKVFTNRITGPLKNLKKKEPYYYLEINPFWYKCLGVVNNRGVDLYIVKKRKKNIIFKWNNLDEDNAFLSFFFSQKKEEKNKFFISNMNRINIYEINNDYNGVAQQKLIILKDNIIQIGDFLNDLIYAFDQKNTIKLINYINQNNNNNNTDNHDISNKNNEYKFTDTYSINNNNEIIKNKDEDNLKFLLSFKNYLSAKNGTIFMYNKNNILFLNSLSLYDGVSKIYNSTSITQNIDNWDILFKIGIDIYKKNHPIWKITNMNKFQELYIKYSLCFLSLLIIQLGNNENNNDEFNNIINKFNELISFLFEVEFFNFITGEKNNLNSIFINSKLEDLYFYLLEPYIIENKFINMTNLPNSFINNLIDIFLHKKNKDSKFIKMNKSWLSELLVHFNIKKYIEKGKNNGLLENIKENYLINTIIYFILNYNSNEIFINNLIDYNTPLTLLIRLLKSNIKKEQKDENKDENSIKIDLNNDELFKKENRYKDQIIYSTEYLRVKILWYIYTILKNKILIDTQEKTEEHKKNVFIKEILKITLDKELFNLIVFGNNIENENNLNDSLDRELIYILNIIFEKEIISKYTDFSKEEIFQTLISLLENKKECQISLNILLIKSMISDKGIELSNEIKLNLVLFFMENNCLNSDIYPEIKDIKFQDNLIEILKSIDSYTFDDSEKLIKLVDKCQNNYTKLVNYIKTNFKN